MTVSVSDDTNTYVFTETRRDVDFVMFHNLTDPANADAPFDAIEQRKLSITVKRSKVQASPGTNRNDRVMIHLERPVLREAPAGSSNSAGYSPPAVVDHRLVCNVEFILPEQATDADIVQLLNQAKNCLGQSDVEAGVKVRSTAIVT